MSTPSGPVVFLLDARRRLPPRRPRRPRPPGRGLIIGAAIAVGALTAWLLELLSR